MYYRTMGKLVASHHPRRHIKSVNYALRGIMHAVLNEANFRVQLAIATVCLLAGLFYKISIFEWIAIVLVCGMLLSAELINTAIEEFIDHLIHEHHEGARVIKDLTAGYVLTTALCALIVFLLIFLPKIF
jgi:undecaprenol kinase